MVEHQEAWQVFNAAGLPVAGSSIAPKESRGNSSVIVGAVHVWIWRKTINGVEVLLQHRAKDKSESQLEYIFSYRNFENGIKWVYLLEQLEDEKYTFNDGEGQALRWVSLPQFLDMTQNPEDNNLVPHPTEYYSLLQKALAHFV